MSAYTTWHVKGVKITGDHEAELIAVEIRAVTSNEARKLAIASGSLSFVISVRHQSEVEVT